MKINISLSNRLQTAEIKKRLHENMKRALAAAGTEAAGQIKKAGDAMDVRRTGRMLNAVGWRRVDDHTVEVGTPVKYALFVHEGHRARNGRFIRGRPFLRQGLTDGLPRIQAVFDQEIKRGF